MPKPPVKAEQVRDRTWVHRRLGASLLLSEQDIAFLYAMRPLCARCRRPVESFAWTRPVGDRAVTFTARCHGETETTSVGFDELPALFSLGVQGGTAFAGAKKLENER